MKIKASIAVLFTIVGLSFVLGLVAGCDETSDPINASGESGDTEELTAPADTAEEEPQPVAAPQPTATERLVSSGVVDGTGGPFEGEYFVGTDYGPDGRDGEYYATALVFYLGYTLNYQDDQPPFISPIFDQLSLDESDVGRTFTVASAADDPDFPAFVALLTNGEDDWLVFVPSFAPDPGWVSVSGSKDGVWLGHGNQITRITLTVQQLTLRQKTDGAGYWENGTYYSYYYIVRFYGIPLAQ